MRIDRAVSKFKGMFVSDAVVPRKVLFGPLQGLTFRTDLRVQTQFVLGLYEKEIYSWLDKLTSRIETFVDVGAANGVYTLYGLTCTTASTIITFEPDDASRSKLIDNLHLNGLTADDLILCDKYVGREADTDTCKLNDFEDHIHSPCCMKVDIDGGEVNLLQGATRILEMSDIRWLVETHSQELEAKCLKILQEYGYRTHIVDNGWWRMIFSESRPPHNRWIVGYRDD